MGAFGSCLGVGRPLKPGANPRLLASNLVNVDANPFGPVAGPNNKPLMRAPPPNSRQAYIHQQQQPQPSPISKLIRQSSALSSNNPQQHSPSQTVPKLVDIDDPLDKPMQVSHLICNRKPSQMNAANQASDDVASSFMQSIRTCPNDTRDLIALYDYEQRAKDDLEFKKGEHLETTVHLMNGQWWIARSKSTKKIGYVPSNYVAELKSLGAERWYLAKIGRQEAEMRLKMPENEDGAFIIRDSDTSQNQYSLSVKHEDGVKHYRIRQFETGGYFINKKTVFSTVHDLVSHYSARADGLCINLREPCTSRCKPEPAGLYHDTGDKWEADRSKVTLSHELGHGQFGQVFQGLYENVTPVAVKTLRKGSMDPQDFLAEAQIMKRMKHPNLVQLYAVCTKEEPVYIITELMSKGALVNYLQTDEGRNLPMAEYIRMATQIASGMYYLEESKFVHRDLAARNILVGDNNVCKIADFGLARFIKETEYEARAGARFPIKWTAPEAANFSKFTIKSDVWSFGIVLYEIITKGATPYPEMSNADVLNQIDKGYRMPQPKQCESKYYSIMLNCWNKEPHKRPTFHTLYHELNDYWMSSEQYREASQFLDNQS